MRSLKKGIYIDANLLQKIQRGKREAVVRTWSRGSAISPEMVGFTLEIHNGKTFTPVKITEDMVGHRLGEFSPTKKFVRHGGKMQREIEAKQKEAESSQAKQAQK